MDEILDIDFITYEYMHLENSLHRKTKKLLLRVSDNSPLLKSLLISNIICDNNIALSLTFCRELLSF